MVVGEKWEIKNKRISSENACYQYFTIDDLMANCPMQV